MGTSWNMIFITIIIKYFTYFSCIYIKKKTRSRHKMCHDNHDSGWAKDGCRWVQKDIDGCKRVHWGTCIWGDTEMRWEKTQGTRIAWKHDTWPGNFPDVMFKGGGTEEAQRRHRTTQMYSILCVRVVVCRYVCVSIETTRKKVKQSNKTDATIAQKKTKKRTT